MLVALRSTTVAAVILTVLGTGGCTSGGSPTLAAGSGGTTPTSSPTTSTRSAEAFCAALEKHKARYLQAMDAAQSKDALTGLVESAAAVGDLRVMWQDLARVAPEEVQTDTESVRDAWLKQEDNAASGNLRASLTVAMLYSGSMGRVDAFARRNCDATSGSSTGSVTRLTGSGVVLLEASGSSVKLSVVDMSSGAVTDGPSFTSNGTTFPDQSYVLMNNGSSLAYRALFSPDYGQMVATAAGSAGDALTRHVGWIDQSGTFTDVSARSPVGDFASTEADDTPTFDVNGSLWFARREAAKNSLDSMWKSSPQMMRYVPRATAAQAVGKPFDEVNYTLVPGGTPSPLGAVSFVFNATTADGQTGCWGANDIVGGTCVTTDVNGHQVIVHPTYSRTTDSSKYLTPNGLTQDGKKLLPETNLTVNHPVISPDGSRVAFLASDPGDNAHLRLFVVPIEGGQPQRVMTQAAIASSAVPIGWR